MYKRGLFVLLTIVIAMLGAACSSEQGRTDPDVGALRMPLQGSAPSGNTYQLNGAIFQVSKMSGLVAELDSDVDPTATVLSADLPVGSYQINLLPMWTMFDVATGNPVSATLISAATQSFDINAGVTTTVAYQFRVNGEITVIGGTLEVVLDITESTCGADPKAAALAACTARFGMNCFDTGSASYIGFGGSSSQFQNCTVDPTQWEQFCYADVLDDFNCNTCQIGAIKLAHDPCICGDNTATVDNFCGG